LRKIRKRRKKKVPEQVKPFPEYPRLHEQLKPPIVFEHVALESQLCVPNVHSLISVIRFDY